MGRRAFSLALSVVWLLAGAAGDARADLLQDLGATFQQAAQELAAAFPRVEVRVAAVDGAEVRLDGEGAARLREGLELVVYRKGERFRHPITGQPLGQSEDEVATLTVTAVSGQQAVARTVATEGGREVTVGDGARITAGRIPVAVLPTLGVGAALEGADQAAFLLVARFSALLEKTGRFVAVEPRRVLEVLGPTRAQPALSALALARRLGATAVITSRLVQDGRARHLETTWLSGRSGATLVSLRTPLARGALPPRFVWEQTPELERRFELDGAVRGLAVADLDGDGRAEVVVAGEQVVTVYRWQEGAGLLAVAGGTMRTGGLVLSLDAADVNGTGRAQVVLVDHRGGGRETIRSRVLELVGGELRTLHDVTGRYLRVVRVAGQPWLLEQGAGVTEPFAPTIRRQVWEAGAYRDGAVVKVPAGVSVYGLALMRLSGSADPDVVALTPEDRLAVWTARGQRLWTSAEALGGAAIAFPYAPLAEGRGQAGSDGIIGRILGRVIPLDDGDGAEILVFENLLPVGDPGRRFLPRLTPAVFSQGRVHRLRWKDGGFVRAWQSGITGGYIADFAYGDLTGDGSPEVIVGVVPRGFNLETLNPFGRSRGYLVFYELP